MTTPEQIAKGLSEAQKRYLLGEMRDIGNPEVFFLCSDEARERRMIPTRTALTRKGLLASTRFGPTCFTTLGLAVREVLKEI